MRAPAILLVALAALLLTWIQCSRVDREPSELVFFDPERWAAAATEHGQGLIRYSAPASTPSQSSEDPSGVSSELTVAQGTANLPVHSMGLVTPNAVRWLSNVCDNIIAGGDMELVRSEKDASLSSAQRSWSQIEALKDMYLYKAVQELIRSGGYITFPVGEAPPPCPEGCVYVELGPAALRSGQEGKLVVWVDTKRRQELADVYGMLSETRAAARWERLRDWNNRPEADRRAEIDDYLSLSSKAVGDATKNLTADEFARYRASARNPAGSRRRSHSRAHDVVRATRFRKALRAGVARAAECQRSPECAHFALRLT